MDFPQVFIKQVEELLGIDAKSYFEALKEPPPVSIRYNPTKGLGEVDLDKVPWCEEAYYLPERKSFTLDPRFHGGHYYVQEASSMVLDYCFRRALDLEQALVALDLCAAPGGKSTLMASFLNEKSLLVSNEVIRSRFHILTENMTKWGCPNVLLSNHDSQDFLGLPSRFDAILVDAPCSGEGLFRKQANAVEEWSPDNVQLCAGRQKRILANVLPSLRAGGVICYSTCTMNRKENEENVEWMEQEFGLEVLKFEFPKEWGISESFPKAGKGYRMYPHKVKGEGFFFCFLKKRGDTAITIPRKKRSGQAKFHLTKVNKTKNALFNNLLEDASRFALYEDGKGQVYALPSVLEEEMGAIAKVLKRSKPVLEMGIAKHHKIIPAAALALTNELDSGLPRIRVTLKEALLYLKKEALRGSYNLDKGWALIEYEGFVLGWVKVLPNRMNNYYPKEWRIRMAIE